ncbi:MAG: hypothetical protein EAZ97_10640 [Bacteroidetes bacterium]|nr:MAG: hypothetical protein EAZ97_10640 [Bacteroidota bacterium]
MASAVVKIKGGILSSLLLFSLRQQLTDCICSEKSGMITVADRSGTMAILRVKNDEIEVLEPKFKFKSRLLRLMMYFAIPLCIGFLILVDIKLLVIVVIIVPTSFLLYKFYKNVYNQQYEVYLREVALSKKVLLTIAKAYELAPKEQKAPPPPPAPKVAAPAKPAPEKTPPPAGDKPKS